MGAMGTRRGHRRPVTGASYMAESYPFVGIGANQLRILSSLVAGDRSARHLPMQLTGKDKSDDILSEQQVR
jgi:hypothetical protein